MGQGSRRVLCGLKEESWALRESSSEADFHPRARQACPKRGCAASSRGTEGERSQGAIALEGLAWKEKVLLGYLQWNMPSHLEPLEHFWARWLSQVGQDTGAP